LIQRDPTFNQKCKEKKGIKLLAMCKSSRLAFAASLAKQDTALRRRHFAVKDLKEHAFDGSFPETGHVAPPPEYYAHGASSGNIRKPAKSGGLL